MVTGAVDVSTGKPYYGVSDIKGNPTMADEIHPVMQSILEKIGVSKTNYPLNNCGEFNAINNALLDGANLSNLQVTSIEIATGLNKIPCINCQSLYGEFINFIK